MKISCRKSNIAKLRFASIDSRWQILQEHRGFLSFTIALTEFYIHSTLIWGCLFVCWYKCVDLSPHSGRCSQIGGWIIWCWLIEIKKSHERGNPKRQIVANWSKTRRLCPENCTSFRAISWQTDFIFNPQLTSCKLRGTISALSLSEQLPVNNILALRIKVLWHWHWQWT